MSSSESPRNRQWLLANRPAGAISESDFTWTESPVPEPGPGEVLVHNIYLSVDPYMRGRMREGKSYIKPVALGAVMEGGTVGEVVASNNPAFQVGDLVEERLGWQDYAISDGRGLRRIDPALAPMSTALGVLGMPGMTAYFGTLEIGALKAGDVVVVSAASGAVGGLVGQIARIGGASKVIGIAGGAEKCAYCVDVLGFDACLDYHSFKNDGSALLKALRAAAPDGINLYFDNVGGWISDAVYPAMAFKGRVAICGMISEYNLTTPDLVPRVSRHVLVNRLKIEGFIVFDFVHRYAEALPRMAGWIRDGRLHYREDIVDGLENAPKALMKLFTGQNFGKQLVRIRDYA